MTLRPVYTDAAPVRPGEVRDMDEDGVTRAQAVKRLVELAEQEPRLVYDFQAWVDRLAALWAAKPTWWHWRRWRD